MPGVVAAEVYVEIGAMVHPLTGRVEARRSRPRIRCDRRDAEERASRALAAIHIETE